MNKPQKVIIGYHANCNDGLMAAAALVQCLHLPMNAALIELNYSDEKEAELVSHVVSSIHKEYAVTVYCVDYCPKAQTLEKLNELVGFYGISVLVIDHHAGAIAAKAEKGVVPEFAGIDFHYRADMSGCGLVWNYFHKCESNYFPQSIQFVQDRDLWKFSFGEATHCFHAFLSTIPRDVESFRQRALHPASLSQALTLGKQIYEQDLKEITKLVNGAKDVCLLLKSGAKVKATAFTASRKDLVSEACSTLIRGGHRIVVVPSVSDDCSGIVWSIRTNSTNPPELTALAIAKSFGGGGHKEAAGFKTRALSDVLTDY